MVRKTRAIAKLTRPRLYDPIPRERLFDRLDQLRRLSLVWVCGPPGSGKTSLVSSWLDARRARFVWYQVDSSDIEPATSFSFLVELARHGHERAKPLPYLTPDYLSDLPAFARRFFGELCRRLPRDCVLVFDNCEEAAGPAFHSLIEQASSQLPERMTLVAISRMDTPAEFSRLYANRAAGVLTWDDLRLTRDEAVAILERCDLNDPVAVEDVLQKADGWAAGLVLLAASVKRGARISQGTDLSTREALFAYFAGEIFERAPPAYREMLMRTAPLPEVSPQWATELSGNPTAATLLEQLYRRQYFTNRRTEPELCYRYHDLFREFLVARAQQIYSPTEWSHIVQKAADLLVARSLFEPAVELYRQAGAYQQIEFIILEHAEDLMRQGRWQTLLSWLKAVPVAYAEESPWLFYWLGVAEQVTDVPRSRLALERAVDLFAARSDRAGEALAMSTIVDGYFQEWHTVETLDRWLDALMRLVDESAGDMPRSYLSRAHTSLLVGLLHRRPSDPALLECVRAVMACVADESDPSERLRMMLYLLLYHDLMGHSREAEELIDHIPSVSAARRVAPRLRIWATFRCAHHHMLIGDDQRAIAEVELARQISREEGVDISPGFLHVCHATVLLNAGRAEEARQQLHEARPLLQATRLMNVLFFHWAELWAEVLLGDITRAQSLWDAFAKMPTVGVHFHLAYNHATIFLLVERGDIADALSRVTRWRELLSGMGSTYIKYNLDLLEAYIRLRMGDRADACSMLRSGFSAAAAGGFYSSLCWIPAIMSRLCAEALREGIESDFVAKLIQRKRLNAPGDAQYWAWPVKIYTLGRFLVFRDNEPIRFAHRPQHRPLELLQAIIAAGDAGALTHQLMTRLWPDSEGDAAHNVLSATLHRLRKLLGYEASILVDDARVSLNAEICWVDALAFDRAATKALSEPHSNTSSEDVVRLYSGHFLGEDVESPWAVSFRDRLRAKFQRLVLTVGKGLEEQGKWQRAADLYRRALEVDNLHEEAYRRLMICLREVGETAEAKSVYRRCRDLLSIVLAVSPSAETQAVFQSLQD
jgi:ATP/maltotriose-dependent transcriptional regulator MalT/DNA-binding SARP family transcriptional activator